MKCFLDGLICMSLCVSWVHLSAEELQWWSVKDEKLSDSWLPEQFFENPNAIIFQDGHIQLAWEQLFYVDTEFLEQRVYRVSQVQDGEKLLALRLLYRGNPWPDYRRLQHWPEKELSPQDRQKKLTILRSWRWAGVRVPAEVYTRFCAQTLDEELLSSAWLNFYQVDAAAALQCLLRLADEQRDDAFPAAQRTLVRRMALTGLLRYFPNELNHYERPLREALLYGRSSERYPLVELIQIPLHAQLRQQTLLSLLEQAADAALDDIDKLSLIRLLSLGGAFLENYVLLHELTNLLDSEDRGLVMASAGALFDVSALPESLSERAYRRALLRLNSEEDEAIRGALQALLSRFKQRQVQLDDEWQELRRHREDIELIRK